MALKSDEQRAAEASIETLKKHEGFAEFWNSCSDIHEDIINEISVNIHNNTC